MSKIFVTGNGRGFVASHLIPKLISIGHEVVTDMRYLHTRKYDCLIHLAAKTSISCDFDADLINSNIILTNEIFKVNTRIIFGSSCSSAHLTNPYAYTKRYGEHLAALHGNAVSLRFHNIYGTGATRGIVWWLMQQKDGAKITIRGPELQRDYIAIENVVDAIIANIGYSDIIINTDALYEEVEKLNMKPQDFIKLALEQNIMFGEKKYVSGKKNTGVIDVGTGVATSTMELLNLYMKLSGKFFYVDVEEAGANEPQEMVSNNIVPHISLEQGLKKLIG